MSRAEEFIKKQSHVIENPTTVWISSYNARKAVEIAREEMIEKFYSWLKSNATYIHPRKGTEECITTLGKLKEAMKDE